MRAASWLAAVLGPVLVGSAYFSWLMSWESAEDVQAAENAGRVLNGTVTRGDSAVAIDRLLASSKPKVLLLGPSYANTDVQPELLAARLGLDPDEVALISVPNSVGAHWYALLKYRVFDPGYRPEMVVVVSGLQSMLLASPLTEASRANLEVQLPASGPDAVLAQKMRFDPFLWMGQLREKRGLVRESLLNAVRVAPKRLGWVPEGVVVRDALDEVFDDRRVDMRLHHAGSVVDARSFERHHDPAALPEVDDSLLPDLARLGASHGAKVVFVRPPMSPHIPAHLDDQVPADKEARAVERVQRLGAVFLDLRGLPMTEAMFKNEDHMNEEGSRRFTEALSMVLGELRAAPPLAAPLEPLAQPSGDPPPSEESAALGEGLWLRPGGRLSWSLPAWSVERGPLKIWAVLDQRVAAPRGRLSAVVAGEVLPLRASKRGELRRWSLEAVGTAPEGPFDLHLDNPQDGGWARLVALGLGVPPARVVLAGQESDLDGAEAPLFGRVRLPDGTIESTAAQPVYGRSPVKVPGADRPIQAMDGPIARFDTERWRFLSDEELQGATVFGSRCSPLRVLEDGKVLPLPNVPCGDVLRLGAGRTCHTPEALLFSSSDGVDPAGSGRVYTLALDPARQCDGAAWLYPKDTLSVAWPEPSLAGLTAGASRFTLGLRYLQHRSAGLKVRLRAGERLLLDVRLDAPLLKAGRQVFDLDPPLSPGEGPVVLELENEEYVFYLLEEATLHER